MVKSSRIDSQKKKKKSSCIINSDVGPYSKSHFKMLDAEDLCRILVQQKDKETPSLFLFFFEKRPRLFTRCFAVVVILFKSYPLGKNEITQKRRKHRHTFCFIEALFNDFESPSTKRKKMNNIVK